MIPNIAIVGMQHQGYVLAAGFADMGYQVRAVGAKLLNMPNEPGLKEMIRKNIIAGRLQFEPQIRNALHGADFVFLSEDISFDKLGVNIVPIRRLVAEIEAVRSDNSILCVTTQVPVGISETFTSGSLAYIPELLRPGRSLENFLNPDRVIVGSNDPFVAQDVAALYKPLRRPIYTMSLRSAEMAKHAHNAILATQISFTNEMDKICKRVGANIHDVMQATKADERVGRHSYLNPGWTLSRGHAIRDVRVLRTLGVYTPLMNAVIEVEDELNAPKK